MKRLALMLINKNTKLLFATVTTGVLLVGCGGGGSSATDSTATGYFIDSAVQNVYYETNSSLNGYTDEYGRFYYNKGDKVKFSIGKLILGETTPLADGLVTPATLAESNDTVTLMLQVLQSLDSDGNATNGITIEPSVVNDLSELNNTILFNEINESYLIDLDNKFDLGLDKDYNGHLDIDPTQAREHFQKSEQAFKQGYKPDTNSSFGQGNGNFNENGSAQYSYGFDLDNYPKTSVLTQELKDSLSHMGNEERLAHDVYMALYDYYKENSNLEINQFYNIATRSESRHISIVQSLVQRYDLNVSDFTNVDKTIVEDHNMSATNMPSGVYDIQKIQDLYDTLYSLGINSQEDALKVGCMVEVTDINDLDEYIQQAKESNATDITAAFEVLRDGSYNHYWAFDKALKNIGIENGCYIEGDSLLTNKVGVYPQNGTTQQGKGYGKGNMFGKQ